MSTAGPKQQVFASLAEIAQALGHAHRLELLEHLGQGEGVSKSWRRAPASHSRMPPAI